MSHRLTCLCASSSYFAMRATTPLHEPCVCASPSPQNQQHLAFPPGCRLPLMADYATPMPLNEFFQTTYDHRPTPTDLTSAINVRTPNTLPLSLSLPPWRNAAPARIQLPQDTAEMYPVPSSAPGWKPGLTEEFIGTWLAKNPDLRADLVLATKVSGFNPQSETGGNRFVPRKPSADCRLDRESIHMVGRRRARGWGRGRGWAMPALHRGNQELRYGSQSCASCIRLISIAAAPSTCCTS
jgi:hypothetical protein